MVKYYITYLRLSIVSAVIGSLEIETMCVHVGGGGGWVEFFMNRGNFKVLILQRIPGQS